MLPSYDDREAGTSCFDRENTLMQTPRSRNVDRHRAFVISSSTLLVSFLLAGCGAGGVISSPVYPVKGQVLLSTGKPLTSGKVIFLPKDGTGMTATGAIGSDGTFALKTADNREGAPAGAYKVRIEPAGVVPSVKGGHIETKNLPFPAQYMDEDGETGLIATVKTEPTQLEPFKLVAGTKSKSSQSRSND
jgi:hypothetical protein